jgi:hypothetical protein
MHLPRIALSLPLLVLLAACDNSPRAPAASQPAAKTPAASATASPVAAAPLFGSWAAVLANCGTAAVTISATRFAGAENQCDVKTLADNGDGTFTASLACAAQGQAASENIQMTPVFAPTGEGVVLNYLDRGGEKVTLLRCK